MSSSLLSLFSLSSSFCHKDPVWSEHTHINLTSFKQNSSWQKRERKKGGSKERERETGEASAGWKQSWCCWFHWVYWERRAARVTSANISEPQSHGGLCVNTPVNTSFLFIHLTYCFTSDSERGRIFDFLTCCSLFNLLYLLCPHVSVRQSLSMFFSQTSQTPSHRFR